MNEVFLNLERCKHYGVLVSGFIRLANGSALLAVNVNFGQNSNKSA